MMRLLLLLISCNLLLTSCFTSRTLDNAKLGRRPERVDSVFASYKDTAGNTVIIYSKKNHTELYKAVVPFHTVVQRATQAEGRAYKDSTIPNFVGAFTTGNSLRQKWSTYLVLLEHETALKDTSGLYNEVQQDQRVITKNDKKLLIPVISAGKTYREERALQAVSFRTNTQNYNIAFMPQRRKKWLYALVPATVALDVVTLPVQLIGGAYCLLVGCP